MSLDDEMWHPRIVYRPEGEVEVRVEGAQSDVMRISVTSKDGSWATAEVSRKEALRFAHALLGWAVEEP